jgi:hypothetical protein
MPASDGNTQFVVYPSVSLTVVIARLRPDDEPPCDVLTSIPLEAVFEQGLVPSAIIGRLRHATNMETAAEGDDAFPPEDFIANPNFLNVLHHIVAEHAPTLPEFESTARKMGSGWMFLVDGRTKASAGVIPQRDIVGVFNVSDGCVASNRYLRNAAHELVTEDGFFRLHEALIARLDEELLARNAQRKPSLSAEEHSGRAAYFAREQIVALFRQRVDSLESGRQDALHFYAADVAFESEAASMNGLAHEVWQWHEAAPAPGAPLRGRVVAGPQRRPADEIVALLKDAAAELADKTQVNFINFHVRPTGEPRIWELVGEMRFGDESFVCFGVTG